MSKSISSREGGQSRRRREENKAVVLCESLRLDVSPPYLPVSPPPASASGSTPSPTYWTCETYEQPSPKPPGRVASRPVEDNPPTSPYIRRRQNSFTPTEKCASDNLETLYRQKNRHGPRPASDSGWRCCDNSKYNS